MYRVYYYLTGGSVVSVKEFEALTEATEFAISLPINSVLEIKYYDDVNQKKPNRN